MQQIKKYANETKPVKAADSLVDNKIYIEQLSNLVTMVIREYNEAVHERNEHVLEIKKIKQKIITNQLRLLCLENRIDLNEPVQITHRNDNLKLLKEMQISYKPVN